MAELGRRLLEIPVKMQGKMLRPALRKSLEPTLEEARRLVPKRTGLLSRSLVITSKTYKGNPEARVNIKEQTITVQRRRKGKVRAKKIRVAGPAYYGRFVELGRSKPRMTITPFLGPALERTAPEDLTILRDELEKRMRQEYGY
jgi:hypothetical protein